MLSHNQKSEAVWAILGLAVCIGLPMYVMHVLLSGV